MKKKLLSIVQYVIFLGGGIFLVWWQLKEMTDEDKKEFYNAFHHANYWLIIPVVIMCLLSHLSRSIRWKLLMEPLDYNPKLKNVFAVTMVGYLANSAVPRLGEILKCTFLARYEKLKVEKLLGTILVERTFDLLCYLIFIGITVLIQINLIGSSLKERFSQIANAPGVPLWLKITIAAVAITGIVLLIKYLFKRFPRSKIISKINNIFKGLGEGFSTIRSLKKRKQFLYHTLFIWTMYLLQIYVGFQAMNATAHLDLKAACSVLTLATLAMIATPGGIGSFPLFVMQTLSIYGIASPLGKAFGWLIWGVSTAIIVVVGLICLVALPYINRKHIIHETGRFDTGENLYDPETHG